MRFANVVSLLALFLSLGGVSYAVTQIDDNSVSSRHVVNSSLTGYDIKTGSITASDIKDGTISATDVLGGLPGITYFKYLAKQPLLNKNWTTLITDKVHKGDYAVTAQVAIEGSKGAHVSLACQVLYGAQANPPKAAYGYESRVLSSSSGFVEPEWVTIDLSGVYVAAADGTPVLLRCGAATNGAPLKVIDARLQSVELRDLQIEPEA